MDSKLIKPAENVVVFDPETMQQLNTEGEIKVLTTYWLRRIADGSVSIIETENKESEQEDTKLKRGKRND